VKIDFEIIGANCIIKIEGCINDPDILEFQSLVNDILLLSEKNSEHIRSILIDMQKTHYISSIAIRSLFSLHNILKKSNQELKIINVPDLINQIFESVSLNKTLTITRV